MSTPGGGKRGRKIPSKLLRDMRLVYGQEPSQDKTPGQKMLRKLYKDDPGKFVDRLAGLERAQQAAGKSSGRREQAPEPGQPVERDEGTERVIDLIDKLLGEDWPAERDRHRPASTSASP